MSEKYDFRRALRLEKRIDDAAGEALKVRWEFGQWMLTFVPEDQKKLPDGFIAGLAEATGSSRRELQYRRQFAETFDNEALCNALHNGLAWHEIVNELLVREPGARAAATMAGVDEWETPAELFALLDAEFRFELDVCATAENARCERFFTADQDGLRQTWRGSCWMNPPHTDGLEPWVAKARRAAEDDRKTMVVSLLPARTDVSWWWEHCLEAEIRFLPGRLEQSGGGEVSFPCAVVAFGRKSRVVWWDPARDREAVT